MKWFLAGLLICWANFALGGELDSTQQVSEIQCLADSEWESYCHRCRCLSNGVAECEKLEQCESSSLGSPISCKPYTIFQRDCNVCECLPDGAANCTRQECSPSIDSTPAKQPQLVGKECAIGSEWMSRCNECFCNSDGYPSCTEKECPGLENELDLRCPPLTVWMNDCNSCWCNDLGIAICTRMGCSNDISDEADFQVDGENKEPVEETDLENEVHVILIDDTRNLLKKSACKPNKQFQMDCNPCKCSEDGQSFTCERNECMETDDGNESDISKDVEVFMKTEGVDHIERHSDLVCKPRAIFSIGCNTCQCNRDGSDFHCTNKPCPLPKDVEIFDELKTLRLLKVEANGTKAIVCSANRMFIQNCNTCWCNEDGTSFFCTRKICVIETPEDSTQDVQEQDGKVKQKCKPDEVFEMDCNMCRCNSEGTSFSCTRRFCHPDDVKVSMVSRKTRAVQQEPPKTCLPGQVFRLDCNKCLCDNEGQDFSCTRIDCNALNTINDASRTKRETTREVSSNCMAGTVFHRECNVCRCGADGRTASCTTDSCRPKYDTSPSAGDFDPNFRCNPGDQFRSDCNDCSCTADGKSVFCTLRLCAMYKL